jgi:hypothetical protein
VYQKRPYKQKNGLAMGNGVSLSLIFPVHSQRRTAMTDRIQVLEQEIDRLRDEVDRVDSYAMSVHKVLWAILPLLLRDHEKADKLHDVMKFDADRYEELEDHPERAKPNERKEDYEAGNQLYHHLAMMNVWPNIDHVEAADRVIQRAGMTPKPFRSDE